MRCWISADVWLSGVFLIPFASISNMSEDFSSIPFLNDAILRCFKIIPTTSSKFEARKAGKKFFHITQCWGKKDKARVPSLNFHEFFAVFCPLFLLDLCSLPVIWRSVIILPILSKLWEWWPWTSMNGENLCIFTSIYLWFVFICEISCLAFRPFVFLRCQETFKKGVSQYAGNARETYCKLTGMTVQWVPGLSFNSEGSAWRSMCSEILM